MFHSSRPACAKSPRTSQFAPALSQNLFCDFQGTSFLYSTLPISLGWLVFPFLELAARYAGILFKFSLYCLVLDSLNFPNDFEFYSNLLQASPAGSSTA